MSTHIIPRLVQWPSQQQGIGMLKDGFTQGRAVGRVMNGVVGAIDGTHVPIRPPKEYPEVWVNRKGVHSMQLQLVVDAKMNVLDAYTGHPGSVHDARVFRDSPLGQVLLSGDSSSVCPEGTYVIGDAAYPLLPSLVTPFKNVGINEQHKDEFNTIHSSTRMVVERAIGLLKGRNRRLMHHVDVVGEEDIADAIMSAVVIHQLALRCDDVSDIDGLIEEVNSTAISDNQPFNQHHEQAGTGELKRQAIMEQLHLA